MDVRKIILAPVSMKFETFIFVASENFGKNNWGKYFFESEKIEVEKISLIKNFFRLVRHQQRCFHLVFFLKSLIGY